MDTGTAIAGIIVARPLRRNAYTTAVTRRTARISVRCVSLSEARMVVDRSEAKVMSMSCGSAARSRGTAARTPSSVVMMIAPGWRKMMTSTAGLLDWSLV